ncbi:MAG: hypothetical protein ACI8Y4_004221 [Candidatus Poriferisodalaceae bacterium]
MALPAGEPFGAAFDKVFEADKFEGSLHSAGATGLSETETNVLSNGDMREQRSVLKHHANSPPFGRHEDGIGTSVSNNLVAEPNRAGGWTFKPRDDAQEGGFSAAAGSQEHQRLARPSAHRNIAQDWPLAVAMHDVGHVQFDWATHRQWYYVSSMPYTRCRANFRHCSTPTVPVSSRRPWP